VELGEQKLAAQRFIAKHPLFLNLSLVQQIAQEAETNWEPPSPSSSSGSLVREPSKVKLPNPEKFCEGLLVVCNEQLPIISSVFIEEAKPLQLLFMERIFGQSVHTLDCMLSSLFFFLSYSFSFSFSFSVVGVWRLPLGAGAKREQGSLFAHAGVAV